MHPRAGNPPEDEGATQDVPGEKDQETDWSATNSAATLGGPAAPSPVVHLARYAIERELGRGGMGVVYAARDTVLDRVVALKVLRGGAGARASARQRFLREARAVSRLRHPNIVELWDVGEENGLAWFTMRLVEGPTLAERIAEGPMSAERAARLVADLARALAHAHAQGLVHRDVKPGNVLLDGDTPVLTDFGLVKELDEDDGLTRNTQVLGTPAYMSPEQARGDTRAITPASDQYALGVVLHELLTGQRPFAADSPAVLMQRILTDTPPPLERAGVSPGLARVCRRAMAREPEQRFPDTNALADALEAWLRGEVAVSTMDDLSRRARASFVRSQRPLGFGLLFTAGALLLLLGGASWLAHRAQARVEQDAEARRVAMEAQSLALRTQDRSDEADALFRAYAAFDGNAGTAALGRAWLAEGQRRAGLDDPDAQGALARAYAVSPEATVRAEALITLAGLLHAEQAWDRLSALLETLDAQLPAHRDDPRLAPLRGALRVTRRDFRGAAAVMGEPWQPLLEALAHGTRTERAATAAVPWDVDGDGVEEVALLFGDPVTLEVVGADPNLPSLRRIPWDWVSALYSIPKPLPGLHAIPGAALVWIRERCVVVTPGEEGPIEHGSWPCTLPLDAAAGDLLGDGQEAIYLGDNRSLVRVSPQDWTPEPYHLGTNASNSEVRGVLMEDLDGDGALELTLATSGWGSFDVRVLRPQAQGPVLSTRLRIGENLRQRPARINGVPHLVVFQAHEPDQRISVQAFGPDLPHGGPRGYHILGLGPEGLVTRAVIPTPQTSYRTLASVDSLAFASWIEFFTGDLDGDGTSEIIAQIGRAWTWIGHRDPDGAWHGLSIEGIQPLATADLDADGDDELLVRTNTSDARVWVLGAGSDTLPQLDPAPTQVRPPPPGVAAPQLWSRAEDLVAIGLTEEAQARFEELADHHAGTPTEGLARMRAAELAEQEGQLAAAAALYRRAARDPAQAAAGWTGAWRCLRADRRFEGALDAARARIALPDPPPELVSDAEALTAWLAQSPFTLDFTQAPDPDWLLDGRLGAQWDAQARGLRTLAHRLWPALSIPLVWDGGPISLTVTLEPGRMDWASRAHLGFEAPGEPPRGGVSWTWSGGGGELGWGAICWGQINNGFTWRDGRRELKGEVTWTWTYSPDEGMASCTMQTPDGVVDHHTYTLPDPPLTPGPVSLTLTAQTGENAVSEALLKRVTLRGFTPGAAHADAVAQASALLTRGHPAEALVVLGDRDDLDAELARLVALDALGREDEVRARVKRALAHDPTLGGTLEVLLLFAPDRFAEAVHAALGDRYFPVFFRAYETIFSMHPDAPRTLDAATRWLDGLEALPPDAYAAFEDRVAQTRLLTVRARAWRREGRAGRAQEDLARAEQVIAGMQAAAGLDLPTRATVGRLHQDLERERARLHLDRREPDAALAALLRALDAAPSPDVFADVLTADPTLESLRALPGWAPIAAARKAATPPE
ncbi:MAG: protein kinase [Alphaproteobacteria bacterium]|nr:protein kinase [Alphaproteobacteria bacterium]